MGLIHCYCGEGKGKTTSAIGLAMRFIGSGGKVCIVQFLKGSESCEVYPLEKLPQVTLLRNSEDLGFTFNMSQEDMEKCREMHSRNLECAMEIVGNGENYMLILDEITYVYDMGLADKGLIERLVTQKPKALELVITGRTPHRLFTENADYISEIKCVKHPFEKGVSARRGIEY